MGLWWWNVAIWRRKLEGFIRERRERERALCASPPVNEWLLRRSLLKLVGRHYLSVVVSGGVYRLLRATSHMSREPWARDLVMVRTLDSHSKAVPWVLGKPLYVVTGPQA
jgi:hypothetical protein